MTYVNIITPIFAGIGALTGIISLWINRPRVIIKVRQTDEDILRINIINKTKETIELKEFGIHLSSGKDISREETWPGTKISFVRLAPGNDFPSDWSIKTLKTDFGKDLSGTKLSFVYARDTYIKKYPYKCSIPRQIRKLFN